MYPKKKYRRTKPKIVYLNLLVADVDGKIKTIPFDWAELCKELGDRKDFRAFRRQLERAVRISMRQKRVFELTHKPKHKKFKLKRRKL